MTEVVWEQQMVGEGVGQLELKHRAEVAVLELEGVEALKVRLPEPGEQYWAVMVVLKEVQACSMAA